MAGYIGLKSWMIARIDPKTKKVITDESKGGLTTNMNVPGVFRVDLNSSGGATQANISNLQGTITKTYGSNAVARAAAGTPEPTVALGANGIPFDIIQKITGMVQNADGSYTRTTDAEINHCALLINSTTFDGDDGYVGFYDGTVTMGNTNIQTNNQSEKITADTLTFTALGVDAEVGQSSTAGTSIDTVTQGGAVKTLTTGNSVKVYSMFNSGAKGFNYDKMIAEIFPQGGSDSASSNVLPSGTPSSTVTPNVPADNGSNPVVTPNTSSASSSTPATSGAVSTASGTTAATSTATSSATSTSKPVSSGSVPASTNSDASKSSTTGSNSTSTSNK